MRANRLPVPNRCAVIPDVLQIRVARRTSGWRFIGRSIVFHLFIDQLFELFRCQIDLLIQRIEAFTLDHRGERQTNLFCIRRTAVTGRYQRNRIAFLVIGARVRTGF